jgi:ribonucleoside-diphosphate reductase alpha chain
MDPENGQTLETASTWVIHFPVKSPETAILREDMTAIDQCEHWLKNKLYWTEHNPSVTIQYKPDEVIDLIKWVSDHKNIIGGMSFLPVDNAQYTQKPYEEISEEQFNELNDSFPKIDFSEVYIYEKEDMTEATNELACVSGVCSIDEYQAIEAAKKAHLIPS